jgi:seryl-tRNA synthetase
MPGIAEQVATIEHDLQEALAQNESLAAEREALTKALTAMTSEKSDLEAKRDDMQSLVDETRELADKLAEMALGMLRASRRKVAAPQSNDSDRELKDSGAPTELAAQIDAPAPPQPDFTGQSTGLKRVSQPEGMTAAHRLRAHLLLDTAAAALERQSPRAKLPDRMPMFLQTKGQALGARHAEVMD